MGYLGDYNDTENEQFAQSTPSSLNSKATTTVAMASGNPYMMAGSFLVNYLQARAEREARKRENDVKIAEKYGDDQNKALDSLNQSWKSALLG